MARLYGCAEVCNNSVRAHERVQADWRAEDAAEGFGEGEHDRDEGLERMERLEREVKLQKHGRLQQALDTGGDVEERGQRVAELCRHLHAQHLADVAHRRVLWSQVRGRAARPPGGGRPRRRC